MIRKVALLFGLALLGALLLFAVSGMPRTGDSGAPDKSYIVDRYIERGLFEAGDQSIPNDVLLNYRAFDTFAGVMALFALSCATMTVLERARRDKSRSLPDVSRVRSGIMPRTVTRLLVPLTIVFAIFITAMGRDSMGYSLQTGVVIGGVIVLLSLVFSLLETNRRLSVRWRTALESIAVLVFLVIGAIPIFAGATFLTLTVPGLSAGWQKFVRVFMMYSMDIGIGVAVAVTITSVLFSLMREEKYELQ